MGVHSIVAVCVVVFDDEVDIVDVLVVVVVFVTVLVVWVLVDVFVAVVVFVVVVLVIFMVLDVLVVVFVAVVDAGRVVVEFVLVVVLTGMGVLTTNEVEHSGLHSLHLESWQARSQEPPNEIGQWFWRKQPTTVVVVVTVVLVFVDVVVASSLQLQWHIGVIGALAVCFLDVVDLLGVVVG